MNQLAVKLEERAEKSVAQLDGASDDRVEDRLHVGLRPADDAQDLARRRLLLQRLGQLSIARPQLREQPYVLDGDDRLVGEGLEQGDLLVREWRHLIPGNEDMPDGDAVAKHRDCKSASIAGRCCGRKRILGILKHVCYVDHAASQYRPASHAPPAWRLRKYLVELRPSLGADVVVRHEVHEATVKLTDDPIDCPTELRGTGGDRFEGWSDVGRRAADDPQDLARRRL